MRRKYNFILCFLLFLFFFGVVYCALASEYKHIGKEEIKAMLQTEEGVTKGHELNAEDLIDAVKEIKKEKGEGIDIKISQCVIKGDLELERIAIEKRGGIEIENKIGIVSSVLEGNVITHLGFRVFKDYGCSTPMANYTAVYIPIEYPCIFKKKVSFFNSDFLKGCYFRDARFYTDVDFSLAQFAEKAYFLSSSFMGNASFAGYYRGFRSEALFSETHFFKKADFYCENFNGNVDFDNSVFHGEVSFVGASFTEKVNFINSEFLQRVNFNGARFRKEVSFKGSRFNEEVSFLKYHSPTIVPHTDIEFGNKVDFSEAIFKRIFIDWNAIKGGKLVYNSSVYEAIAKNFNELGWEQKAEEVICEMLMRKWKRIKGGEEAYSLAGYQTIIRGFNNLGRYRDADDAYFEFRSRRRKEEQPKDWYSRVWEFIVEKSCGYGVRPFYVFWWWFGMVVIFSLFFFRKGALQERIPGNPSLQLLGKPFLRRLRDAAYFSVSTFTKISLSNFATTDNKLVDFSVKVPVYSFTEKKWRRRIFNIKLLTFRFLALVEGIFGWMLMALFLVCLGKVYIR